MASLQTSDLVLPPPPRSALQHANDAAMGFWLGLRTGGARSTRDCLFVAHDAATLSSLSGACSPAAGADRKLGEVRRRDDLPPKGPRVVRFVVVSDTHARHAELGALPKGDVFVHSGDILMSSRLWSPGGCVEQYRDFNAWLGSAAVRCPVKLVIGGNHDRELEAMGPLAAKALFSHATYLENEGFVWRGGEAAGVSHGADAGTAPDTAPVALHIFGTPLSSGRSRNSAFQSDAFAAATRRALAAELEALEVASEAAAASAPAGLVLLTHGPNLRLRGACLEANGPAGEPGSGGLRPRLLAHLWGHAHGAHGATAVTARHSGGSVPLVSVCGSIMDTSYCALNLPIVVDVCV